jgi:4,5-dihydroxyphthalate decarboxylase
MRLKTLLGDYPVTNALKKGRVASTMVELDYADVTPPHAGFKRVVRDLEFDVAEIAIVTFLMAKAYGKPYVLLPAVMFGRFQHPYLVAVREMEPQELEGKTVAIRSNSVTTVAWLRGILSDDYGVDLSKVRWITFEDAHVAEFKDPPNSVRAPAGKTALGMLLAGEVDAAILSDPVPQDPRLRPVIPDPPAAIESWRRRKAPLQINHMVAIRKELVGAVSREVFRLLSESRKIAEREDKQSVEGSPFGIAENWRNLEVAVDYVHRQGLIPRRYAVEELFEA